MKKLIVVIHGGDTFQSDEKFLEHLRNATADLDRFRVKKEDWKSTLQSKLGEEYDVLQPIMPNKQNAKYKEWMIWFDKIIPLLNDEVIFVGHSLGATFLVKYLSEKKVSKKVEAVFLVAGHYDATGEELDSFVTPSKIDLPADNVFMYHSHDDFVVPFDSLEKFQKAIPNSKVRALEGRTHFLDENFPEIITDIKSLNG